MAVVSKRELIIIKGICVLISVIGIFNIVYSQDVVQDYDPDLKIGIELTEEGRNLTTTKSPLVNKYISVKSQTFWSFHTFLRAVQIVCLIHGIFAIISALWLFTKAFIVNNFENIIVYPKWMNVVDWISYLVSLPLYGLSICISLELNVSHRLYQEKTNDYIPDVTPWLVAFNFIGLVGMTWLQSVEKFRKIGLHEVPKSHEDETNESYNGRFNDLINI